MYAAHLLDHRKFTVACAVAIAIAIAPLLSGCKVTRALLFPETPETQSEYGRDIEARGPGSQEAWLKATGGTYNGNLPRD